MKLLARVEDFFQLAHHSIVMMRFVSEDGRIRVKGKIQLRAPDGHVTDTYVVAIECVKRNLLGPPRDPYVCGIDLPPEITKVALGTEIWSLRE